MDDVRFGVVGLGFGHGRSLLISKTEGARLVAVCDTDEARCRRTADATGCEWTQDYEALVARDDIDVVQVMVPSGLHAQFGIKAAHAGKHVVTTKPIEVTLEAADRLIDACTKAGVMLAVDLQYRYLPAVATVKNALDHDLLGRPVFGEVILKWHRPQSYYDVAWRGSTEYDGGVLMNQTIHDIDVLLWWLGNPKTVTGHTSVNTHNIDAPDLGMAVIEFDNGATGRVLGTTTSPIDQPSLKEVYGDKLGAKVVGQSLTWLVPDGLSEPDLTYDGPMNIVEDVVASLREGRQPLVNGAEGRRSLELVDAINRSAAAQAPVVLSTNARR